MRRPQPPLSYPQNRQRPLQELSSNNHQIITRIHRNIQFYRPLGGFNLEASYLKNLSTSDKILLPNESNEETYSLGENSFKRCKTEENSSPSSQTRTNPEDKKSLAISV